MLVSYFHIEADKLQLIPIPEVEVMQVLIQPDLPSQYRLFFSTVGISGVTADPGIAPVHRIDGGAFCQTDGGFFAPTADRRR